MPDQPDQKPDMHILGLSTAELAGVSVDEVVENKTAVTMVMHYYKQLVEENASLKNDLNTLRTYVDGYRTSRNDARIGGALSAMSGIGIAFGSSLLTDHQWWAGAATFVPGISFLICGLYFSFRNQDS